MKVTSRDVGRRDATRSDGSGVGESGVEALEGVIR